MAADEQVHCEGDRVARARQRRGLDGRNRHQGLYDGERRPFSVNKELAWRGIGDGLYCNILAVYIIANRWKVAIKRVI